LLEEILELALSPRVISFGLKCWLRVFGLLFDDDFCLLERAFDFLILNDFFIAFIDGDIFFVLQQFFTLFVDFRLLFEFFQLPLGT
jgi:hypothetical protein